MEYAMDDTLQLTFLGVGNAAAQALGNAAAVLEGADGRPLLLIDCGPTVLPAYIDRHGRLPEALFITHTHLDHVGGLENLFYRLACGESDGPPVRLFVPAPIVDRLHRLLADDAFRLAEGGVNFWDCFQLIPVGEHFWLHDRLFDVFEVNHHAYRSAFGVALPGYFAYTGDTRPVPEALARFAAAGERVFHDCALQGNPSHTGIDDLEALYPPALRERIVAYHYESVAAGAALEDRGLRIARPLQTFKLERASRPELRRVV
jgi:glyoxylase-like metal-dependent hydrolase (beta-lactamase superfamily II)